MALHGDEHYIFGHAILLRGSFVASAVLLDLDVECSVVQHNLSEGRTGIAVVGVVGFAVLVPVLFDWFIRLNSIF